MQTLADIYQNRIPSRSEYSRERSAVTVQRLTDAHEDEVLGFLAARPVHTFGIVGFIHNNGLVSEHNRGAFYACRSRDGRLEGVALIGHHILLETKSDAAIKAFAHVAQGYQMAHMLMGEQEKVKAFWNYYARGGKALRLYCRELLLQLKGPVQVNWALPEFRLATLDDLDLIVPAHAQTAFDESGINPLDVDPEGFRKRCARRIEQGRSWVYIKDGKLIFKAEIVTDTPEVVYLEGVWTNPQERGKGYGTRCMSQLSGMFLDRTDSLCILVNDRFKGSQAFYQKIGYKLVCYYDTIFLNHETAPTA